MTRQEAIERLNKMRRVCDMEECNINCELCDEALDLAIEALSEERESGEEKSCKGCKYLCDPFGNLCNQCTRALYDRYESVGEEE